ncbi:MAG: hypothetical protein ABJ382_14320, partial [Ilumatobacter sp.]
MSSGGIVVVVVCGVVAALAVAVVALDARRVRRRLDASATDLAATHEGVRRLLDGLPDAVLSVDAGG